jgi:hypothetical protein
MPRGPKGGKRPTDVNARAVMIAKIAAAVALGRMGGNAAVHAANECLL